MGFYIIIKPQKKGRLTPLVEKGLVQCRPLAEDDPFCFEYTLRDETGIVLYMDLS